MPTGSLLGRARVQQAVQIPVGERLPRGLDDVLRDADRGPRLLTVRHVDQDANDGSGPDALVEYSDTEVLELHRVELRVVVHERLPERVVQRSEERRVGKECGSRMTREE